MLHTKPLGGTAIDCSENCDIGTCNVGGIDVVFTGSGEVWVSGDVYNIGNTTFSSGCNVTLASGVNWSL